MLEKNRPPPTPDIAILLQKGIWYFKAEPESTAVENEVCVKISF